LVIRILPRNTNPQIRINTPVAGFMGIHSAVFSVRVAQERYKRPDIRLKQTSLNDRATCNKTDDFEAVVLRTLETALKAERSCEETFLYGKRVARCLAPLYISKACLACHGDPAGELAVTGRAKERYTEGILRGAISVVVPVR
jgi:general secretion pathway protein A